MANVIKTHLTQVPQASIVVLDQYKMPSDYIKFQTPPRSIQDGKVANFDSQTILGRSEPLRAYTSSNARGITFSIDYYWYDMNPSGAGSWTFIESNINKLKALTYPKHTQGFQPTPRVLFYFGRVYRGIPCIVNSVALDLKDPWVNPDDGDVYDGDVVPFQTTVNIALEVAYDYDDARGHEDIRSGSDNTVRPDIATTLENVVSGAVRRGLTYLSKGGR